MFLGAPFPSWLGWFITPICSVLLIPIISWIESKRDMTEEEINVIEDDF